MRMLMNVKFPNAEFNAAMRDGNAGQKITRILDEIKPESVYFTEQEGQRSVILIVNLNDPSNVPTLAEPWFLAFNASVEYKIVMTPEDLKNAGLDEIAKKWA
jgi:hypothetical protein